MDNKVNIGGDRLGSGKDMKVDLHNFNKSTHDLSYVWRSSMASGTLVPFMNKTALPGDEWEIDLYNDIMTLPTIGPLFGSYKVQLDVFSIPYRLYHKKLFNNTLNIGMDMHSIKLPRIRFDYDDNDFFDLIEEYSDDGSLKNDIMVGYSSLLRYLGISGTNNNNEEEGSFREFNGVPYCAYWDIYKNYYANRQEEDGVMIYNENNFVNVLSTAYIVDSNNFWTALDFPVDIDFSDNAKIRMEVEDPNSIDLEIIEILVNGSETYIDNLFNNVSIQGNFIIWSNPVVSQIASVQFESGINESVPLLNPNTPKPSLLRFPLENIDSFREIILGHLGNDAIVVNDENNFGAGAPYTHVGRIPGQDANYFTPDRFTQNALGIKCYQSDLFNNWVQTEFIDGSNGVNEIASVDTSEGSFNLDQLNLANKVYNMLNRIAITGGSYDDYLKGAYGNERKTGIYSPVYHGSLIKELAFQEVISNTKTDEQPLGTLAGRGKLTGKNKGGKIKIKCSEHCVIMGIISLTPRVTYSQGNQWDANLKNMGDFHNPNLNQLGYQDLITDQLDWRDTSFVDDNLEYNSVGKQPSWINYMTEVDKSFGNFADEDKEMFMTLNRRYDNTGGGIEDLTTYIDPSKFNNIFADTRLDAQNFWAQIKVDAKVRRKVSSKTIPNL